MPIKKEILDTSDDDIRDDDDINIDDNCLDTSDDNDLDETDIDSDEMTVIEDGDDSNTDDISKDKVLEKKESKHKEAGKHALQYDSIFKGKKEDSDLDEYILESVSKNNSFDPDASSSYAFERESPTEYTRLNRLKQNLYDVIINDLKLNIKNSTDEALGIFFEYSGSWYRDNEHISTMATMMDMSEEQTDDFFTEAKKI